MARWTRTGKHGGQSGALRTALPKVQTPVSSVATGPSFIVGIGASAGGFEALSALIAGLGKPTRMAFVVVQHLLPTQASALPELLWKATHVEVDHRRGRHARAPESRVRDLAQRRPRHPARVLQLTGAAVRTTTTLAD